MPDIPTLQELVLSCRSKFSGDAVECEGRTLSYSEFDRNADKIASALIAAGACPGKAVAVRMKRSERLIEVMFGVFRCGAAFVPISEDAPPERQRKILESSGALCLISDESYPELILRNAPCPELFPKARPEETAMILFTSGSTGMPKGACLTQISAALDFLQFPERIAEAGIPSGEYEAVISRTSECFAYAYHFEIPAALIRGKKLILLTEEERNTAEKVGAAMRNHPHSLLSLTPSLLGVFLKDECFRREMTSLSVLTLGAEPVSDAVRKQLLSCVSDNAALIHQYGSTECQNIVVSDLRSHVRGGFPFSYEDIRILSTEASGSCQTLPAGEKGEICVFTPAMISGYISGGELRTAEIDGRIYCRTGDFGVLSGEGRLSCLGRLDRMIKLHGLRIEPGEIEACLRCMDGVTGAAVSDVINESGTEILCAYYTGKAELSEKTLRDSLEKLLPAYMVPSLFLYLDEMPLTAGGKTDFIRLRTMPLPKICGRSGKAIPAEGKEAAVAEILAGMTETDVSLLSPDSTLISLGIDSLRITELSGRIEKLGYRTQPDALLPNRSIAEFASLLTEKTNEGAHGNISDGIGEPGRKYPVTPIQKHWIIEQQAGRRRTGLRPIKAFIAEKVYSEAGLRERLTGIVHRHAALRSTFEVSETGEYFQTVHANGCFGCELIDLRPYNSGMDFPRNLSKRAEGMLKMHYFRLLAEYTADDGKKDSIPLHVTCVRLSEDTSAFIVIVNHLSSDGTSEKIIEKELLMRELPDGCDSYLPYLDYISEEENRAEAESFLREYYRGACPAVFRKNPCSTGKADRRTLMLTLEEKVTQRLMKRCAEEEVSVPVMVTWLYGKALMLITGKQAVSFEALFHGRALPLPGMNSTVGCLIDRLPVVIRAGENVRDFYAGYMKAGSSAFLSAKNGKANPCAPGAIVSEIGNSGADVFSREFMRPDYAALTEENFLTVDNGMLDLFFHFDADLIDEKDFTDMTKCLKTYLTWC